MGDVVYIYETALGNIVRGLRSRVKAASRKIGRLRQEHPGAGGEALTLRVGSRDARARGPCAERHVGLVAKKSGIDSIFALSH